jgi:hypothetical protein
VCAFELFHYVIQELLLTDTLRLVDRENIPVPLHTEQAITSDRLVSDESERRNSNDDNSLKVERIGVLIFSHSPSS